MSRRGRVHLDDRAVGWLEETSKGVLFRYDAEWLDDPAAQPVSLTLPLRAEPYESPELGPFFLGLLPEGWLLDVAVKRFRIDRKDAFGLLLALGRDCAGAAWVVDVTVPESAEEGDGV